MPPAERSIVLPPPRLESSLSVETAIVRRRSVRRYQSQPLTLAQLSQVLWSAQGITSPRYGLRVVPSAGATYPLELYVVVGLGGVEALEPGGAYHYEIEGHALTIVAPGERRPQLAAAALGQRFLREAPVSKIIAAVFERTTQTYGQRGHDRYVPTEAGHAGQNIHLQAEALGLGTVAVGAFRDREGRPCSAPAPRLYLSASCLWASPQYIA